MFYTSIVLLVAMIALEVVRFLIFLVCYLFGYRIWIFPDLDRDDKGIFGARGAVGTVCELLHIAQPTLYKYLQEIKEE